MLLKTISVYMYNLHGQLRFNKYQFIPYIKNFKYIKELLISYKCVFNHKIT